CRSPLWHPGGPLCGLAGGLGGGPGVVVVVPAFVAPGRPAPGHPRPVSRFEEGSILVAGRNFGCGSSREHAPQALMRWGIRAVVAESFAEIFFGNCTALGIPCMRAGRGELERMARWVEDNPAGEITVDLVAQEVRFGGERVAGHIPESARDALTSGRFDFLAQLLEAQDAIRETAGSIPYVAGF
ncbi:MAG: hypothetical protein KY476_15095, partial [Planctomycetes bacterium]|nr:hypothetical protein [Planctomycetota bacterium]